MPESLGIWETSAVDDGLIAGDYPLKSKSITVKSGQGEVKRGTIMGKITKELGVVGPGSNTGDGTITAVTMGKDAKHGKYVIKCVEAIADGGRFKVINPDGNRLDDADVGVAYVSKEVNFTLNDGPADFVVGDTFEINVDNPAGEEWIVSLAAAVDGSNELDCIMTHDVDATSTAVLKSGYITGDFDQNKLIFGAGHSVGSLIEEARSKNVYFYDVKVAPGA